MNKCNATLTVADVRPCLVSGCNTCTDPDREVALEGKHVTLYTLTCDGRSGCFLDTTGVRCHDSDSDGEGPNASAIWRDDTPGATPHTEPLVSQAEVAEALAAMRDGVYTPTVSMVRRGLEAAAKVRQEAGES